MNTWSPYQENPILGDPRTPDAEFLKWKCLWASKGLDPVAQQKVTIHMKTNQVGTLIPLGH